MRVILLFPLFFFPFFNVGAMDFEMIRMVKTISIEESISFKEEEQEEQEEQKKQQQ